ncbi:MAG: hypothetical protein J4478_04965 [Candidatus Diapherotrites archaeon]|uniref:Uncharacterized protein n=2 Tax=Candidatus Iainarchaeum sp. TaxID=3101447 RepID=A0A8T4KWI0_9ARCH|nr:hypothetical protein [Candidatus Diapherotrites archaeon]
MAKEEKGFSRGSGSGKTLLAFVLILGIIIGGLIAIYAIYPEMNKTLLKENSDLKEKNKLLEQEADSIINCLQENNVDYYQECGP